jgi:hypothetical protein
MALFVEPFAFVSYLMTNQNPKSKRPKVATFETRITAAAGKAFVAAADDAARLASSVGSLVTKTNALSLGVPIAWGVKYQVVDGSADAPAADAGVYPFDKFAAQLAAGLDNYQITIPARKDSAVVFESDGVSLDLTDGANVQDWIVAFEAIALGKNGTTPSVERMFVVS